MIYEYAVEPKCLREWQNFRYLVEHFGVSRGRLISQFPKDWLKQVYGTCSGFSFRQKQQLEIELKRLKKGGLVRSGREYDKSKDWVTNALSQFEKDHPFHAVIVDSFANPPDGVLIADEITPGDSCWQNDREVRVERTVYALGNAVAGLLKIADRIIFVDKMFTPNSDRWQILLAKFIALASIERNKSPIIEYHTKIDNDEYGKLAEERMQEFHNDCDEHLGHLIPKGLSLKIVRWDKHHRGDFFHERCILTDKGGIRIDWGLDVGKPGETTLVSLMEDNVWEESWANFQKDASIFKYVDEIIVDGALSEE